MARPPKRHSGSFGLDGQRVDAPGHQIAQGIIHKPVALNGGQTPEARRTDAHLEVGAGVLAVVACVAMVRGGVVPHVQQLGLQLCLHEDLQLHER